MLIEAWLCQKTKGARRPSAVGLTQVLRHRAALSLSLRLSAVWLIAEFPRDLDPSLVPGSGCSLWSLGCVSSHSGNNAQYFLCGHVAADKPTD